MLGMMKNILSVLILWVLKSEGAFVKFTGLPAAVKFSENLPAGSAVYKFKTAGTLPSGLPSIINTNPLTKAFRVDPIEPSGDYQVVYTGDPVLDYETMPNSFDLQIFAKYATGATNLQTLTVQLINVNEPPFFVDNMAFQSVSIYIRERAAAGVIYKIQACDPEDRICDREDPHDNLKYTINSASPALFSVSPPASISSTKIFDYEKDEHTYYLSVTVEDPQGLSVKGALVVQIVNINDEPPKFIGPKYLLFHIDEETRPGTVIANVTAVDPDDDGTKSTLLYSFNTPTMFFEINQFTGVVQVLRIIDRENEPFRQHPEVTLEIVVQDGINFDPSERFELKIIIDDINDNPPVCKAYALSVAVPENEVKGRNIIDLAQECKDVDVEDRYNEFNFTGLSGLGENQRFKMESPGSGRIVVNGDLNFEDPNNLALGNEYSLRVMIQNIASPHYKQTIYVYVKTTQVNEFPPVFKRTSYVFSVSEVVPAYAVIGQVYASDPDWPFNGITYSIEAGDGTLDYSKLFWMDPNTGSLHIVTSLDYETTKQYNLTVRATDLSSAVSTVLVTVDVLEVNDEKPICKPNSYSLAVPVSLAVGTNIQNFRLTCTDRDSDPRSFLYFFDKGNIYNQFTFSPNAGSNVTSLILASPFGYLTGSKMIWDYKLLVYITDNNLMTSEPKFNRNTQTGTVTLNIHVYVPGLTTQITTTTPSITYLIKRENAYSASTWYVPFIITLGSILLAGLLAYLLYRLAKCIRCPPRTKAHKAPSIESKTIEKRKKEKLETVWELTRLNTVFDGEAVDPITGKIYEYNSKSGARRWKDTKLPTDLATVDPTAQELSSLPANVTERKSQVGTPSKKEKSSADKAMKAAGPEEAPKPLEGDPETAKQATPRLQKSREGKPNPSAKVTPKTPPQPNVNKDNAAGDVNLGSN
uniref:Cadherin-related family member 3 isoform X2 n=1 Tax=Geotrypetes seraphini TaxID=260995 RepID=A0A6P8S6I3_GEOSA|nr:cadherin-related family member 3 isoform X2 [Geotrypetes seraphini]